MTLSIKFCGGCNPRIDRGRIADQIRNYLVKYGVSVISNDLEADIIIYLSGCSANCSERYTKCNKPSIVIAGTAVNAITVSERQLGSVVIEKITELLE